MESFARAHVVKRNKYYKNRRYSQKKKTHLKQMLYGYKFNDINLIEKSSDYEHIYIDSTSVSGSSDLNITNSGIEHEATMLTLNETNSSSTLNNISENSASSAVSNNNNNNVKIITEDSISACDGSSESSLSVPSFQSDVIFGNGSYKEEETCLNDSIPECNMSNKSCEAEDSLSVNSVNENKSDPCSDSDSSILISGLNLTDSDSSESFDADGQLAAKIQEKLKLRSKKKDKIKPQKNYAGNSGVKNPISKEICEPMQPAIELQQGSQHSSSKEDDEIIVFDAIMSPPYVSITASDMPTEKFDDILGDYKHSTIKNIASKNVNSGFSIYNLGFYVDESMPLDIQTEDEVGSLIPELDDIPKVDEIDEELINLDKTIDSLDNSVTTEHILDETLNKKEQPINYDYVADIFKVYYGSNCCVITLKHPCELFIQGKVKIRALGGTVEIFGYTLKKDTCNVFAPYYNSAQCIKTVENHNVYYGLFGKLTAAGLSVSEAEDIVISIGEYDGIIHLQELKSKAMDFLENNIKITHLFLKPNKIVEPYFNKAADILNCSLFSARPYKSFHVHPNWDEALELAEYKYSRGIVCGGKGVGKSTYLRYQVNKLLTHGPVLVVDLDPGQSEFTVAGNVSATVVQSPLFGPSFAHLRKPELMLTIGMINTMDNAKLYASAVRTLITYCRNNDAFSSMPWIVNTMGMTNALGLKFITLTIVLVQPTFLLQYEAKSEKQRFETILTPPSVKYLFEDYKNDAIFANVTCPEDLEYSTVVAYESNNLVKNAYKLLPREERYLSFLAYFSQLMLTCPVKSLLGVTPYEVSVKDLCIATNVIVKEDYVTKVINGKIVALCQHARQCDSARVFTLSDKPLLCRGHGLIRGIDWEKEILYVITPVPSSVLGDVNTLLYADWVPELMGLESHLPLGTTVPYRILTSEQQKQLMSTPRRRFNPLQLLKMSRTT